VRILLNGAERELAPETATVAHLIRELDLATEQVAVERNRRLVPRAEHDQTELAEGDELEVVTLVGGG